MTNNKLKTKDLISIGIYTALYFICVGIGTLLANILIPVFSSILIPGIVGLISAPIYLLVCSKIPRFGAITIMGLIMGLFFLISGHFALSFIPYVICGIIADCIQNFTGNRQKNATKIISYIIFTFGCTGPLLPLWFMKQAYIDSLVSRGKDTAYINDVFQSITPATFWICIIATIVLSLIGASIGIKIINKHFIRRPIEL
ncbi:MULTISPECIES: MptD family putative ECF transporter S component [unclassified Enterococcus]|uniref:MptD family putative ECF transporter S component n=1 Tax=unclassified Enterococcus TaxID=2608891 RepID=UPI00155414A5|nr:MULTISPECIES: MptD family putative ECF transporter S component [unclassified Enterococcus]MBS7578246.1 MptD family putative ECF transporter S component [Enterococcus sp. MMGLQ5-2]MBS7585515.1 MptD family putative ECF transporter S component [Enterococcus sp. MMGLQ5-1]NPD13374.1 MptD family putative ECF transporter S component [Enterococcus sp. MMGLQ5-1]NPD38077.1 MptD family putative ECF transporter S component [Enterococcus sp. MMGLQ5-2]